MPKPLLWLLLAMSLVALIGRDSPPSAAQSCPPGESLNNLGICAPTDLQAWLDSVPDPEPAHTRHSPAPLVLPPGKYLISSPLTVNSAVNLQAHGAFIQQTTEGQPALIVAAPHTVIEGITLRGKRKHDTLGSRGVLIQAGRVTLRDVWVEDAEVGVEVDGTTANSNGARVFGLHAWRCTIGVQTYGADANAGLFSALDLKDNMTDIEEGSFLGNTWVAPTAHPAASAPEPHIEVTNNSAAPTFVGFYIEGLTGFDTASGTRTVVVGGLPITQAQGNPTRLGAESSYAVFDRDGHPNVEVRPGNSREIPWRLQSDGGDGGRQIDLQVRYIPATDRWCFYDARVGMCIDPENF